MDEVSEKKVRRKNRNKKSRHESSDLELGAETASEAKIEHQIISSDTKDDVWIEKENVAADDKELRKGKNRKESVNYYYFV